MSDPTSPLRGERPVWSFTCYNAETAMGVLAAAENLGRDVILLVSTKAFSDTHGRSLVRCLRQLTDSADVRAHVQLDHASDIDLMRTAFDAGVHSVMADGSRFPLRENVALVQRAVELADRYDGWVEAELGALPGDEDIALRASTSDAGFTDPELVPEFVSATGAACLAVAFGNVHGTYDGPPRLDWDLLDRLRDASTVPLSLHGASGIPVRDVQRAAALGVHKINVNTELRQRFIADIDVHRAASGQGFDVLSLIQATTAGASDVARSKLEIA